MLIDYYDVWCTTDSDTYIAAVLDQVDHAQPAASCTEGIHHLHVLLSLSALLFAVPPYFLSVCEIFRISRPWTRNN